MTEDRTQELTEQVERQDALEAAKKALEEAQATIADLKAQADRLKENEGKLQHIIATRVLAGDAPPEAGPEMTREERIAEALAAVKTAIYAGGGR